MANVTREQIRAARCADLYEWIERFGGSEFRREGGSFRPIFNPSVSVKRGFSGYRDFATDETGNSVDFLTKYMGMDLVSAVQSLLKVSDEGFGIREAQNGLQARTCGLPQPVQGAYRQLFAYLNQTRRIPAELIRKLIRERRIYQEKSHNNIVFVNPQRTFAEVHGTVKERKFHGIAPQSSQTGFWWFRSGPHVKCAYICEAAIDAMSLYVIHRYLCFCAKQKKDYAVFDRLAVPALYVSIAGAANKQRVDAVRKGLGVRPVYLAVDNDDAGQRLRDAYRGAPGVFELIPQRKDWNEDLCSMVDAWNNNGIQFTFPD